MNMRYLICLAMLLGILTIAFATEAADAPVEELEVRTPPPISITELLMSAGILGFVITLICLMSIRQGILAIINSTVEKNEELPLSAKVLPIMSGVAFLLGLFSYSLTTIMVYSHLEWLNMPLRPVDYAKMQKELSVPILMGTGAALISLVLYWIAVVRFERSKQRYLSEPSSRWRGEEDEL